MKKYFLLTSILALTACGGGSGGTGGGAAPVVLPDIPAGMRSAVTADAVTSNEAVTKMKSEVVVAAKGGRSYLARASAPIAGDDGFTFTSYRLDDVKFFAADASTTQDGYLSIGVNDTTGRIEDMTMVIGGSDATPAIARDGETNTFTAHIYEYVQDSFAKDGTSDFVVENDTEAILDAIASKMGFDTSVEGSGWKLVSSAWKFDTDGGDHFATYNPGSGTVEYSVGTTTELMEKALKDVYGFRRGKWVEDGDNLKYLEYGNEAAYRTVGDANTDMTTLNNLATANSLSGGHWNHTDEVLPVVTLGNGLDGEGIDNHGTKLQYSDFGHFNPVYRTKDVDLASGSQAGGWTVSATGEHKVEEDMAAKLADEDYQLFAGGYAIKNDGTMPGDRPSLDPVMGATYKGMAIGRVHTGIEFANGMDSEQRAPYLAAYGLTPDESGHGISKAFTTHEATMKITQSGGQVVQTLNMPFYTHADGAQYYDIEIQQVGNEIDHVNFTATDENDITSKYRLHGADSHWDTEHASFNPGYYGVGTATEAAGTAAIGTQPYDAGLDKDLTPGKATREYEVQAAWGMVK